MLLLAVLALLASGPEEVSLPPIGIIDFYGLRTIPEARAREALGLKEGDSLEPVEALEGRVHDAQRRLETSLGVARTALEFVCCESGRMIVYVGIQQAGDPADSLHQAPQGTIRLPEEMTRAGKAWEDAILPATARGEIGEDDSSGHALSSDPALRSGEERFLEFAARDLPRLREVLRDSADADHRALAAEIVGYAPNKQEVVADLVEATRDASGDVRNNAMRALGVMARAASRSPALGLHIPAEPFVGRLNSIVWTDRNKASMVLSELTETREAGVLHALCNQAIPALQEMARWKAEGHARPSFDMLGRIAELSEEEIKNAWDQGKREEVIAKASACAVSPDGQTGPR